MSTALTSVEKINTLKQGIEAATGETYGTLTEAVQGLKNGYGQGDSTEGGSTGSTGQGGAVEESVNLSYTLNPDGTYMSKDPDKDHIAMVHSTGYYSALIFITEKLYTVDELLGLTMRIKTAKLSNMGLINVPDIEEIEITDDRILKISNTTFGVLNDTNTRLPSLVVLDDDVAGMSIDGYALPQRKGTYLSLNVNGTNSVEGTVCVKKAPEKPYFDTSKVTNFNYFFYYNRGLEQLENLDASNAVYFTNMFYGCTQLRTAPPIELKYAVSVSNMFYGCTQLKEIPQYNTSNVVNFESMFKQCYTIESIPKLDTSKGENFNEMFSNCMSLTTIPLLDLSNASGVHNIFISCNSLKTLSLIINSTADRLSTQTFSYCVLLENLTINKGWAVNIYLHYSNNLTVESLHGMIENLANLTGQASKYFQVGATNLAKIDAEHIDMLNAKNWTYS